MRRLRVVDLFCGCGGFSEGFHQAGFEIVAGFDFWKPAQDSFVANFPDAFVLPKNHGSSICSHCTSKGSIETAKEMRRRKYGGRASPHD